MPNSNIAVFVFNCNYNGLALIQELGRLGVKVFALDSVKSVGTYSRYAKYLKVTDPLIDEKEFIDQLIKYSKQYSIKPLLLPTNDHWAEAISKAKEILEEYCYVSAPNYNVIQLILDKERFALWCDDNKYPVPTVYSIIDVIERKIHVTYPIALKANYRRKSGTNSDGKQWAIIADKLRFNICHNIEDVEKLYKLSMEYNVPIYLQQLVNGRSDSMRTIGVFANAGKVKGIIFGKKLRGYPAQFGDCIVGEATAVPDWAKQLVLSICKKLNYTGIAEFEIMEDSITKENLIIEINPRSWSWVGVGPASGVSLGVMALNELALNQKQDYIQESCPNGGSVIHSKVFEDLLNVLIFYKLENTNDWAGGIGKWRSLYKKKKVVYAGLSIDDPVVSIYTFYCFIRRLLSGIKKIIKNTTQR